MKKVYISILVFLAIFLNIDSVRAAYSEITYPGTCSLVNSSSTTCSYTCSAEEGDNYYKFNYHVNYSNNNLQHSIDDFATDGSCSTFGDYCEKDMPLIGKRIDLENNLNSYPENSYFIVNNALKCRVVAFDVTVTIDSYRGSGSAFMEILTYTNNIDVHIDPNSLGEELKDKYGSEDNICGILGNDDSKIVIFIRKIYRYVKILIPIIIITLSIVDFIKVLVSGKDDDTNKAISKFVKRIIIAVIFILVPALISIFIDMSGVSTQYEGLSDGVKSLLCILG